MCGDVYVPLFKYVFFIKAHFRRQFRLVVFSMVLYCFLRELYSLNPARFRLLSSPVLLFFTDILYIMRQINS